MKHWKTKNRRTLVKDRWISLHADECELPNGQVISPFYVMEEKEWGLLDVFSGWKELI